MSLAVDNPILNNSFEEPREYSIYDEGTFKELNKLVKIVFIKSEGRGRSIRYLLAYVGDYKEAGINGEQTVMTEGQAKYQYGKSIN